MKYSVIIPVYNRPDEVDELLESLTKQTYKNFDTLIIEDGSTLPCKNIVEKYQSELDIKYYYKENTGPGESRNFGMKKATGNYFIIFDSDCVIPPQYFQAVEDGLKTHQFDTFGGPDAAHSSFTDIQKAINYAMTSFITTGGIRGKKRSLDTYQPRSFNMGIKSEVFQKVGGFSDIHPGEDPDLSYRIMKEGYKVGLIEDAFVFHKRRIDFQKFRKQVYKFGIVRPILIKWYPDKFKITYLLPSLFLIGSIFLCLFAAIFHLNFLLPLLAIAGVLFVDALLQTKHLKIAILSVYTSFTQLYSYGFGFLKSAISILIFKKNERAHFPTFFFKK